MQNERETRDPNGAGLTATLVSDVALPVRVVELDNLKTTAGEPVRVQIEAPSELTIAKLLQRWPGGAPPEASVDAAEVDQQEVVDRMQEIAPQLLELGTMMLGLESRPCDLHGPLGDAIAACAQCDEAGMRQKAVEIRPAFWFTKPVPGALPGRLLSDFDTAKMVRAMLELRGFLGAPEDARFHDDERAGGSDGGRPADAGES